MTFPLFLAAIDIGSNAARMQISSVNDFRGQVNFKRVEYIRYPLRLGADVFEQGYIGPARSEKLLKLMRACRALLDLHDVPDAHYLAFATSAMREATNGAELATQVADTTGIRVEIISGEREATVTHEAFFRTLDQKPYLHIDVGGGSTELNLHFGHRRLASASFQVGTVRRLSTKEAPKVWNDVQRWISTHADKGYHPLTAIATGGNINKLYEIADQEKRHKKSVITLQELGEVRDRVANMTLEERINVLMMNPDRADVIVPAADIYLTVMHFARAKKALIPAVGLKDGMIRLLYEQLAAKA